MMSDLPDPKPGQVWVSPLPRVKPRTVTRVFRQSLSSGLWVSYKDHRGKEASLSLKSWRDWAHRANAWPRGEST